MWCNKTNVLFVFRLDVCVRAIEELQKTDFRDKDVSTTASASDDTAASSIALDANGSKNNVDESKSDDSVTVVSVAPSPSAVSMENVSKSNDCNENANGCEIAMPAVEDASTYEDGWSVVQNDD